MSSLIFRVVIFRVGWSVYQITELECAFGLWGVYPCQKIAKKISGSAFLVLCQSVVHVVTPDVLVSFDRDHYTGGDRLCQPLKEMNLLL